MVDGGVCDVLAPAELQRRLLSRHLGLGLPPDVVRRCVATLACIGGHVRYCDVVQALRGARRRVARLHGRPVAADPQVQQMVRSSSAPRARDPRS